MQSLNDAGWPEIEALRTRVANVGTSPTLLEAAGQFAEVFTQSFESVVLARLFAVVPLSSLPPRERDFATSLFSQSAPLADQTPVLTLLGTRGQRPSWNSREASVGHLAIPLIGSASVVEAPMIAKLLSDLEVDLKVLDDGRPIATRQMLGGRNGTFFVEDATTAMDTAGRYIIPARDFVAGLKVRTVFGMGGAYVDGTLVVAILFCSELLDRLVVDRFPSFISSFKMATSRLVRERKVF